MPPRRRRPSLLLWQHDYEQFRARLAEARRSAGLSQHEAAQLLGRPQSFVAKCETGERRVDVVELARFAKLYRRPLAFFAPPPRD